MSIQHVIVYFVFASLLSPFAMLLYFQSHVETYITLVLWGFTALFSTFIVFLEPGRELPLERWVNIDGRFERLEENLMHYVLNSSVTVTPHLEGSRSMSLSRGYSPANVPQYDRSNIASPIGNVFYSIPLPA